jgi:hypothetical protein
MKQSRCHQRHERNRPHLQQALALQPLKHQAHLLLRDHGKAAQRVQEVDLRGGQHRQQYKNIASDAPQLWTECCCKQNAGMHKAGQHVQEVDLRDRAVTQAAVAQGWSATRHRYRQSAGRAQRQHAQCSCPGKRVEM